ncbi:hypothetical protein Taro_033957 [Colocasia esculenta]|uniref:PGG domain-containing protein n=1 Tax=Colocasia esculenta TaxID=4460 RepID=A0A843VZD6_COLES|nr:hypothetical protein [Colocasia esculenta]
MDLRLRSHQQPFFAAVGAGDLDALRRIVEGPDGVRAGSDEAEMAAAVAALMAARNEKGQTGLHVAAEGNQEEVLCYLVGFCDFETAAIRANVGITAFHVAAKCGHTGIVKEFLALWPQLCRICDPSNTSPLYSAAILDHLDVVKAILDADGSSIRIVRKNGKTSLHVTARIGHHRIVKALIEKDPGIVPITDKKGQTALHMAVKGRNPDVVEEMLFVDRSILNARDKKGNTALHIATRKWRPEMVCLLLSYESIEVNSINNQKETAMDLADKIPYGESALQIKESLHDAGAKHARYVGQIDETSELRRQVSDLKHDLHSQLKQNEKTNKRVTGIAKDLRKLHREAVQNTINSVTLVAVLIASVAFMALFNLPGQYLQGGENVGKAHVAENIGFRTFCLLNATALFISLAVVVVQITLVAWETGAQKQVVAVVNKLMWAACVCILGAFLSIAFVDVGKDAPWMAILVTVIGGPMMIITLGIMCFLVFRQYFRFGNDSQRRLSRRGSGSKSYSWSRYSAASDPETFYSDHEKKIYAL